jgi:hypothetical protein
MHKSLATKISKHNEGKAYASERNVTLVRVAQIFNQALDNVEDVCDIDSRFYGSLPSGDQFLHQWANDTEYRKRLLLDDAHTYFLYWKDRGEIREWMMMFEDDYLTIKPAYQELIFENFELGISRAKQCTVKVLPEDHVNHDNDFQATHIDADTIWVYYGYYCYRKYWMRTIEPTANGLSV